MMGKCKKVVSAAVVSTIIAAQTLMPVAAAGSSITSNLTTKTPIIRVQVPTQMAIAVDAFDTAGAGSQIYSEEFDMQNKSEIPVKVSVTSKLTYTSADVELATAKKTASALGEKEAWVAVAAKTAAGKYHDTKSIAELEGNESNITTFAKTATDGEAETKQEFYLAGGTTAVYAMLQKGGSSSSITVDAAELGGYTELYKLTLATVADDAALQTLVDAGDVYHVAAAANKAVLSKISKGTPNVTKGSDTYYSVATTPVLASALTASNDSDLYVYANSAAAGDDVAGFRYIGVLSDGKSGGWSSSDLTKIVISYDITGLTSAAYTEVADDVTYGYKAENNAITLTGNVMRINVKPADFKDGTLKLGDTTAALASSAGTWGTDGEDVTTFTFSSTWANAIKGKTVEVTVNLKDGTSLTATFNVPN